jgi:ferric-dicitrate binding protein FerR (iron transport regulator)
VLRRADYEAYLGNPLGGSSRARYLYAPQAAAPIAAPRAPLRRPRPVAIALALAMFALAATGAVRWWQRS